MTCSWCHQEIRGRWIGIRVPRLGTLRVCKHCSFGFANLFSYGAAALGAINRSQGPLNAHSGHRSER